ncbi:hypothetical protein OIDMADRAFT_134566, partial [Oidiodendron maius Zn]
PARDAVEYKIEVFHSNFGSDRTPYQEPTDDEVDAAGKPSESILDIGLSQIDDEMAVQLLNRTTRIPGDDNGYVIGLDVFHQLHCLNHLRKILYPDRYRIFDNLTGVNLTLAIDHTEHCVDSIRQSLMCSVDISTIYWQWDTARQKTIANAQTTHICKNFEKIQAWARDHAIRD